MTRKIVATVVASLALHEAGKDSGEVCADCGARLAVGDLLRDTCPQCKAVLRMQPGGVPF